MKQFFRFFKLLYPIPCTLYPRRGFTIIEILVVVTITVLLSSLVIVYSQGMRERSALMIEEAKVSQLLLRARALALSTYGKADVTGVAEESCGYGVSINYAANSFSLFKYDRVGNLNDPCGKADLFVHNNIKNNRKTPNTNESYVLNNDVRFINLGCASLEDILFVPPEPRVVFDTVGGGGSCGNSVSSAQIRMETVGSAMSATITVNQFGQISY